MEIIDEKARLLDNPTGAESLEIRSRVEGDFVRGVERNEENERILTIVYATELARETVMGRHIRRQDVMESIQSSDNPAARRAD